MVHLECHDIAAKMFNGDDPGLLHHKLYDKLTDINSMVAHGRPGHSLLSSQVIATIVESWVRSNPKDKPYGE